MWIKVYDQQKGELLLNLDHVIEAMEDNSDQDRPSMILKTLWSTYKIRESWESFTSRIGGVR